MKLIENLSVVPLEEILTTLKEFDVFVSCGSFEERCVRSSTIFLDKRIEIRDSIIFNYKETDPRNKKGENIDKIRKILDQVSQNVCIFDTGSVSLPSEGIKRFLEYLEGNNFDLSGRRVVVDITVFTKPYFFLLFKTLREKFGMSRFHVVYTEPEGYKDREPDTGDIVLTEGLDRVETIPGFFGSCVHSRDTLIVILGFEGKRSMEVFHAVSPQTTYAVNGFPSYQPGWHRISLEANMRFLMESKATDHLYFAPAIDPFETAKALSYIVKRDEINKDSNIIVAPLGTKMQAFGTLLYSLKNVSAKVIYPFPSTYKADYSYGHGPTWICKVNLDTCDV